MQSQIGVVVRRPENKAKDKDPKMTSFRCPAHVKDYLNGQPGGLTEAVLESVEFKRDTEAALQKEHQEILIFAATSLGVEYSADQARVIAHLVKAGLAAEKKGRK